MLSALTIYFIIIFFIILLMIVAFLAYNASFKNIVMIARQTGNSSDNVIWTKDKFKVVNKNGYYVIKFWKRKIKNPDYSGKFYTVFFKPKTVGDSKKLTREEWDRQDMSTKIQRGLFLYENNEGQLFPMKIELDTDGAKFLVLGQNHRRWLADEIKDINELTRNRAKDVILLAAAIIAIASLAVIFIFGFIYMNEQGTKAIGANQVACTQYIDRLINYTQTVEERSGFIKDAQTAIVGG